MLLLLSIEKTLIILYVVTKADGFHYRQPWVIGVQEELERLTKRVEEAEQVMMGVSNLTKQIETLEVSETLLFHRCNYLFHIFLLQ